MISPDNTLYRAAAQPTSSYDVISRHTSSVAAPDQAQAVQAGVDTGEACASQLCAMVQGGFWLSRFAVFAASIHHVSLRFHALYET